MDLPFRIAFLALCIAAGCVGVPHRLRAARSHDKITHDAEGVPIYISLRLCGLLALTVGAAYLIAPQTVAWGRLSLVDWVRWCGGLLGVAGVVLMFWVMSHLGTNITDTVVTRRDHQLVTTGPYRYVRHPFYSTFAIGAVAVTLLTANWLLLLLAAIALTLLIIRTDKEEAMLIAHFGDEYRDYMSRTGRFLPGIGKKTTPR
jgi:protein-S-isoprenylcysteine O-methyltransferase Ste14